MTMAGYWTNTIKSRKYISASNIVKYSLNIIV